ncbi:MAG: DUF1553 domain-containing protein [Verrucomicrobia bacterium]|nr:DUF1553 domain-containing protein [Verrucomicrobiota bacterium]MDA1067287.1 DUF1553 domain-containing protein [Verrucomicrobiota bacterium]
MNNFRTFLLYTLISSVVSPVVFAEVDFNQDILPVLSDNCFKCHGPDENTREADLRLDIKEGAFGDLGGGFYPIVPGKPDESEMIWHINAEDEDDLMPPPDSGLSLTEREKQLIEQWIEEGAEWKKHWSFEAVKRPDLPKVNYSKWPQNEIDYFILAKLEEGGLSPSPETDKTTLIRRLTLDITGLPPTPGEVDAFLTDTKHDAYERLVDRLLDSPRYGEAMALPWLDAARYADTDGYQNDGPREMWRWRDWVIDAYNQNMPFNQFTIEQLAGDLLPDPTEDQLIATGFNRNHRYNSESGLVLEEFRLENAVDRVDTTSTVWMGLTLGCARCHDHKYDPFSTKEYYQLISYFNSITESGRAVKFSNSEPWITAPTKEQSKALSKKDKRIVDARTALESSFPEIELAQSAWESSGVEQASERKFLNKGLIRYYSFNGNDPGVSVLDGQPWLSSGVFGTAASFDGGSLFVVESDPMFVTENRWSISFWIKPDSVSDSVIISRQETNTTRPGITVELKDGHLQFYCMTRWVAGVGAVETLEELIPGEWRHVTVTNDGSYRAGKGMKIFLDGVSVSTRELHNTNSNKQVFAKNAKFRVGGGVVGNNYMGLVDEIRIYDRTLWEDEVAILAVPQSVKELAGIKPKHRSNEATAKLQSYYLDNDATEVHQALVDSLFDARLDRLKFYDSLPTTMVMEELESPMETHVRRRGVYHDLGEKVERKLPTVLVTSDEIFEENRLGLAQWLVNGEHPLTGRVTVNRYWLKYFGRGLVKSAEDFGIQGDRPSHPELLDWLADEFVRLNWDVKAMQKLIVTSATYRQSSRVNRQLLEKDPENVLLARGTRQRLSAHASRDQALAVSGLLVEKLGGPSVSPYQPDKFWEELSNMTYEQSKGEDLFRRSLYTIWKRTLPPPSMAVMNAADRESCMVSLDRTNTPLQALTLLNEKAYVESARNFGQRILLEGGRSIRDRVEFAFRSVAGRYPQEQEQSLLESAYRDYRVLYADDPEAAKKLISVGESKHAENLNSTELAAATTFANMLLNLDEVVTKE